MRMTAKFYNSSKNSLHKFILIYILEPQIESRNRRSMENGKYSFLAFPENNIFVIPRY